MRLTAAAARAWIGRWDRQQEHYLPRRNERFDVMADVLDCCRRRDDLLIVDLGVGPGSLANWLLRRLPAARVVGVDMDPVLVGLAVAAGTDPRLRLVRADLTTAGWLDQLGVDRAPDAYVSTTALHWMDRGPLATLIAQCASHIAPGGVFVDGDHIYTSGDRTEGLNALTVRVAGAAANRRGVTDHENWDEWWQAVEQAPELAELVQERGPAHARHRDERADLDGYLDALVAAGFPVVGQVWQYGDDRVLVGAEHPGSAG